MKNEPTRHAEGALSEVGLDCVFCRIVAGDEPAEVVHESEAAVSIVPLNPVTKGHTLVIPRQHAEFIWRLDPNHLGYTMYDVASLAFDAGVCNIIQSNGTDATQTIPHVHFHVIPRREGDGLHLPWTHTYNEATS